MLISIIGLGLTVFGMAIGGVVWSIRLEGRVNSGEQLAEQRNDSVDERHKETLARFDRQDAAANRTELKLDRLLERSLAA